MHKMSVAFNTAGASTICAVNTRTGRTTVTFCGKANTNKRDGEKDFDGNKCHSAAADCRKEKGTSSNWGKAMQMARNVCAYEQGKELPSGVSYYCRRY